MSFFVSESIEDIIDLDAVAIEDEENQDAEKVEYSSFLLCKMTDEEEIHIPFNSIERKTKNLFIFQNIFFNKVVFSKIIIGSDSLDVTDYVFLRSKDISKSYNVFLEIILEEASNV